MKNRHRFVGTVAVVTLLTASFLAGRPSGAAPPSEDPPTAAAYAAGWLADQIGPDGTVVGGFDPLGDAGSAALALAAAGVEAEAFDRAVARVVDDIEDFIAPAGPDDAGRMGRALLLADAAGLDPHDVNGVDLVVRLDASLGAFTPGLYGAADPTFDGTFRQGIAIAGLAAVGEAPPVSAVDWLSAQQCDHATPAAAGGWQPYRSDTAVPCTAPDSTTFSGPDSNSTAMALLGLAAVGEEPLWDPWVFLASTQAPDGGWAFLVGGLTDPNSTGLVLDAMRAWGESPANWVVGSTTPLDALLSFVIGCGADGAGAFASPYSQGAPDLFANLDAIPAAAGETFPLGGPVELADEAPVPCVDEPTTTSTPSTSSTTSPDDGDRPVDDDDPSGDGDPASDPGASPEATPAVPVPVTPAYTG
jgi:hypothetical protein